MFALHHLRLLLIVLALGLAGALGWELLHPSSPRFAGGPPNYAAAIRPPSAAELAGKRDAIAHELMAIPELAAVVERVSSAYPADWSKLLDAFARRGLDTPAAELPEAYVVDLLRYLRVGHGPMAGKAGNPALTRVLEAQAELFTALSAADKRLCVDFLLGQSSPAFLGFLAERRALLARLAMAMLDAMTEGERDHIEREPPSDDDFNAIEASLRQHGLGAPEIAALLDGKLPDPPISDAALCDAGIVYFDALKSLPDDARMRVYALAVKAMNKF